MNCLTSMQFKRTCNWAAANSLSLSHLSLHFPLVSPCKFSKIDKESKDKNWVGIHAESAYEKFENKKIELSSEASTFVPGEDEADSQPTKVMPSDIDIWVDVVGRKKGRIFGLGSIAKTLNPNQPSMRSDSEVDALRSQVHALNESLQKQEQEKLLMKQQLQRQEKEMAETNRNLTFLMQHLGFVGSSSRPSSSPQLNDETDEDSEDVGSDHIE
uniref:Uncharacterized protein LOC113785790 n=1 Tax=Cicer arietinum TaxID=3827 RepID=A0A3Q7X4J7_CICAR|nr:uncharacterized protein LOC113785790 [Cicer arietinum]